VKGSVLCFRFSFIHEQFGQNCREIVTVICLGKILKSESVNMIARALLLIFYVSMAGAQTANYADIAAGKSKLPYGKAVTLTGKMTDLKCGSGTLATILQNPAITVSYVGLTTPVIATISGTDWSAPLGSLPADHAIVIKLNVTGKIADAERTKIASQLLSSDEFRRALDAFFLTSNNQPPSILQENATRLVRGLTDDQGVITKTLQADAPCLSVPDVSKNIAAQFMAHDQAWANPRTRIDDLKGRVAAFHVEGLDPDASYADAYLFASKHLTCNLASCQENSQNPFTSNPPLTEAQRNQVKQYAIYYKTDYDDLLATFKDDVVAALTADAVVDLSTSTPDLAKYAGFDAGAIYIPRIEELRQFFMVHVYPWGPVDLDTNGLAAIKGWKSRFSIALGASIGDISANSGSRVKNDKAFVYGVGYRINKYFRVSAGGAVFRDTKTFDLHNEAFIGPSIDLTALPGLKQIFASAQSPSNPKN
jgi:hypothetical protein